MLAAAFACVKWGRTRAEDDSGQLPGAPAAKRMVEIVPENGNGMLPAYAGVTGAIESRPTSNGSTLWL